MRIPFKINQLGFLLLFVLVSSQLFGQDTEPRYVQFSGVVVTEDENGDPEPLPYTNIAILNTSRGTISEFDGFFSIVAESGDTVVFSRVGYQDVQHVIADSLSDDFYSWYQVMSQDNVLLPEAVIYPWPSREHYKIEFLAMDVTDELRQLAEENMAEELLEAMVYEMPADGKETFNYENARAWNEYRYEGQYKPQHIFDPIAWSKFIKAWKNGDFKRKKK